MSYYHPSQSRYGKFDPKFFKPTEQEEHMHRKQITDRSYLEHIIPHHQFAVDICVQV
jgi:uncharacterized protein (DUF305 family)